MPIRLGELAAQFDCKLIGDADVLIETVGTIANAQPGALSFISSDAYREQLPLTKAAAVILREEFAPEAPCPALVDANPYAMYARMAAVVCPPPAYPPGVHEAAVVADTVTIGDGVHVAANAVIEEGTVIGRNSYIGPGTVIGPNCNVGDDCRVLANVTLVRDVTVGSRCIFHPGSVIGSDGFGNAMTPEGWVKVPQLGGVTIGSDVEIGANTTIDCGAVEDTVIGNGVRIDNLVQIAHNCQIGDHTAMAAGVGISGSTRIGSRCMFAGHSGTVGHIEVCDDVTLLGQGVLSKDVTEPGVYAGTFVAEKAHTWNRRVASLRRLDKLQNRVRALEKKVQ